MNSVDKLKEKVCKSNLKCYSGDFAKNYDKDNSGYQQTIIPQSLIKIISKLGKKDLKFIEIACGTGRTTHLFFKYPELKKIFCLDISQDMLNVFKNKLNKEEVKKATFICGEATEYFKQTNELFDIILTEGSLHHIMDYEDLLNFSSKKLKQGGYYCIFGEPSPKSDFNFYLEEMISTWDRALNEFRGRPLRQILYFLYSPFSTLSPILNRGVIKKIKDKLLHGGVVEEDLVAYAEYWVYEGKEGLSKEKIKKIFDKNNIEIITIGSYPGYKSRFINKLARILKINVCFSIIARKN